MDLAQLADLGEFVGGVAVLVTLVYLSVQVRHSNEQARRANAIERSAAYREVSRDLMQVQVAMREPELMTTFRRALVDFEGLPNNDKTMLQFRYLGPVTVHTIAIFQAVGEGLIDEEFAGRWLHYYVSLTKSPGIDVFWRHAKPYLQRDFVEHVERLRLDPTTPGVHEAFPWLAPEAEPAPTGAGA